jgi:hypothetical protein
MAVSFFGHLLPKRSLVRIQWFGESAVTRSPRRSRDRRTRFTVFSLQRTHLDEVKELREVPAAHPTFLQCRAAFRQQRTPKSSLGKAPSPRQAQSRAPLRAAALGRVYRTAKIASPTAKSRGWNLGDQSSTNRLTIPESLVVLPVRTGRETSLRSTCGKSRQR